MCSGHKDNGVDSDGVLVEAALHKQPRPVLFAWC